MARPVNRPPLAWEAWPSHKRVMGDPAPTGPKRTRLPPEARRALIAQCYHGRAPHLPPAIESLVNRLQVAADDEDFGEIPQPSRQLTSRLIHRSG